MKVYLAAPYAAREQIKSYAQQLSRIGFRVTSTWLDETHDIVEGSGAAKGIDNTQASQHVEADFHDLSVSDLIVLFTESSVNVDGSSGGRHVETGYALANGLPVVPLCEAGDSGAHLARGGHRALTSAGRP